MGELIVFSNRRVKAKGLDKANKPDETKIKNYFFSTDYQNLSLLTAAANRLAKTTIKTKIPTLFYPGCGVDILFPLKYAEKLFPNLTEINFIFNDLDANLSMIKTVLDDVGISFAEEENKKINFYWNDASVHLQFVQGNVFEMELPAFDIYFEKAFRIMKSYHPEYESNIFAKLNPSGILISDSGFLAFPLQKLTVSKQLSAYNEMIIGVK